VESGDFIRIRNDVGWGRAPHWCHIPPALFVPG